MQGKDGAMKPSYSAPCAGVGAGEECPGGRTRRASGRIAPGGTRTPNPVVRSHVLCPIELRVPFAIARKSYRSRASLAMRMLPSQVPLDARHGFFDVLPAVERAEADVPLTGNAEAASWRADDVAVVQQPIEELPARLIARRLHPRVRRICSAVDLQAQRGELVADQASVAKIELHQPAHLPLPFLAVDRLTPALLDVADAVVARGVTTMPKAMQIDPFARAPGT